MLLNPSELIFGNPLGERSASLQVVGDHRGEDASGYKRQISAFGAQLELWVSRALASPALLGLSERGVPGAGKYVCR